jgi:hypothetical protein
MLARFALDISMSYKFRCHVSVLLVATASAADAQFRAGVQGTVADAVGGTFVEDLFGRSSAGLAGRIDLQARFSF